MSSTSVATTLRVAAHSPIDDRTARARIRDAAITAFTEQGISGTTARRVATIAEVSPALVIHHFGSMDGLRAACDEHVAAVIREEKATALTDVASFDLFAALRTSRVRPLIGYLAQVLADDSPAVARLVDDLVRDAEAYLEAGVAAGTLKPASDPRSRAVVLALWSLGALVLNPHLRRLLSVDLLDPNAVANPATAAYVRSALDIMTDGLFSDEFAAMLRRQLQQAGGGPVDPATDDDSPSPAEPRSRRTTTDA